MRGRIPKPTIVKALEGNRGHERLNVNEPMPQGEIVMPTWISKDAKKEWQKVAPELKRLGLLTSVDVNQLAQYCQCIADIAKLTQEINKEGMVIEGINREGHPYTKTNAKVQIRKETIKIAHSLSQQFGFTPTSRSRLSTAVAPGDGSVQDFINAKMKAG